MKILIIAITVMSLVGCSNMGDPYFKFGMGLKLRETNIDIALDCNKKFTGRAQLGYEIGNLSYGIEHVSDLVCGKPFRGGVEYTNDQLFIDYKIKFGK